MPNLIPNGSFERGTAGWTITVSDPQGAGNAADVNDSLPLAGAQDLRMALYDQGSVTAECAPLAVSSGSDYRLAWWQLTQGSDATASCGIGWYDSGGVLIGSVSADITSTTPTVWTKGTRAVTAPAGAATATIAFVTTAPPGGRESLLFLDNIAFARCVSLLSNGSFEGGLAGWTTSVTGPGTLIAADTNQPQADLQALKLDMPGEGTASATSTAIAVESGRDYLLSLWFKSAGFGAGVSAACECTWHDSGGGSVSTVSASLPGDTQATWAAQGPLRLPAPAGAVTAKVGLTMAAGAGSAASTAWIDGVEFTADPSLVKNSGFEGGLTAWTIATDGGGSVSADASQHQEGAWSLKLDLPAPGSVSATSAAVAVSSGRDLVLTCSYRSAGTNASVAPAVAVTWYNGAGNEIAPAAYVALPLGEPSSWTSVVRRVSPPSGAATAKVACRLSGTTAGAYTLWCDAVRFSQDANQVPNGGFEGGLTGWTVSASGAGASVDASDEQRYEDNHSLKMDLPNPAANASAQTGRFPVSGGSEYEICTYYRSDGFSRSGGYDGVNVSATVYCFDAAQQQIGTIGIGYPYAAQPTWRCWRRIVAAPPDTAYMKWSFGMNAQAGSLPSTFWLDKVEIKPYATRLKVGGGHWLFRVADLGKYNKTCFRRGADDNTSTGAAVIANPIFGTTPNYMALGFYSTAVTAGRHRAVFRMKVGDVSVTRNVANLDVNSANDGTLSVASYTTDSFGQPNTYRNLILRFRKSDSAWVDFRAYWLAQVLTAVDTVTIYEEEADD